MGVVATMRLGETSKSNGRENHCDIWGRRRTIQKTSSSAAKISTRSARKIAFSDEVSLENELGIAITPSIASTLLKGRRQRYDGRLQMEERQEGPDHHRQQQRAELEGRHAVQHLPHHITHSLFTVHAVVHTGIRLRVLSTVRAWDTELR